MPDETAVATAPSAQLQLPVQLRVLAGNPDEAELAALVTVLSLLSTDARAGGPDAAGHPATGWAAYWRSVGAPMPTFPGAWAAAGVSRA